MNRRTSGMSRSTYFVFSMFFSFALCSINWSTMSSLWHLYIYMIFRRFSKHCTAKSEVVSPTRNLGRDPRMGCPGPIFRKLPIYHWYRGRGLSFSRLVIVSYSITSLCLTSIFILVYGSGQNSESCRAAFPGSNFLSFFLSSYIK